MNVVTEIIGTFEAWLVLRSLGSAGLRIDRQCRNAHAVAWAEEHGIRISMSRSRSSRSASFSRQVARSSTLRRAAASPPGLLSRPPSVTAAPS